MHLLPLFVSEKRVLTHSVFSGALYSNEVSIRAFEQFDLFLLNNSRSLNQAAMPAPFLSMHPKVSSFNYTVF